MIEENIAPPRLPQPRRRQPGVRAHRPRPVRGRRELLHRPHRGGRREPGAGGRRLAGPGGRAVLPGHRPAADGPGPAPPLRHPGPQAARHRGRAVRRGRRAAGRRPGRRRRRAPGPGPGLADRRARGGPHRPARRHRRHHPGRAGRGHPLAAPGVLVVQGGPGTGKTVVALHRAAYLLYTHRFPLEGQGVLVVGPNRLFLGYIEQVLPSLGEAGVELAVLADLVDGRPGQGRDAPATARIKGDARMSKVLAKAVRDRERPLRQPLRVPYGVQTLVVPPSGRPRSWPTPGAGSGSTTPAGASSRPSCSRRWPRSAGCPTTAEEVRERAAARPRGAGGARADVAGAHPRPAAPRPVRVEGAGRPGRGPAPRPRTSGPRWTAPRRTTSRRSSGPTTTSRCSTRPGRCSAPARGAGSTAETPTRSAPTATSWSTRPRTCRRCSCGCSTGARSTAR